MRKTKASVSHHEREIQELAANRELAVEYVRTAMQLTYGSATSEKRANLHSGSSFDDFLLEQGTFDETHAKASERARTERIEDALQVDKC